VEILSIHAAINPAAVSGAAKKLTGTRADGVPGSSTESKISPGIAPAQTLTPAEDRAPKEAAEQKREHRVINGEGIGIQFETDAASGTTIIRLVDLESGEVVRQIPPEETLNYLRYLESMIGKIFSRVL